MLRVYTAQYKYSGENRIDITAKSGLKMFAPDWQDVIDVKAKKITEEEYTKRYYEKMRVSYKNHRAEWDWFLTQKSVVLVCFCKPGTFCHRYLLADILVKLGAEYLGDI
jgi:uncharacterized protein YeaO (DUF488 family)